MAKHNERVQYPGLKGSELHHDLKNDPGKEGDPDHAKDDATKQKSGEEMAKK